MHSAVRTEVAVTTGLLTQRIVSFNMACSRVTMLWLLDTGVVGATMHSFGACGAALRQRARGGRRPALRPMRFGQEVDRSLDARLEYAAKSPREWCGRRATRGDRPSGPPYL